MTEPDSEGELDVVPPGVVQMHHWRPDPGAPVIEGNVSGWVGIARTS